MWHFGVSLGGLKREKVNRIETIAEKHEPSEKGSTDFLLRFLRLAKTTGSHGGHSIAPKTISANAASASP